MSNFERTFGRGNFGAYGAGSYVQEMPGLEYHSYQNFSGGMQASDAPGHVQQGASPFNQDMEVDHKDRLVRMPGVDTVETFLGHSPKQMFVQSSLDTAAELIFLDPPWIGVKASGPTVWTNLGLLASAEYFAATNHGDVLLFSNSLNGVWARRAFAATATQVSDAPPAAALTSFAARVIAGNIIVDGNNEPLAVGWSAADSDPENWTGLGAGFEFLIGPTVPDRIVGLFPIGFDILAVLCRRSLWIGSRTGLVDRPVDFQLREDGRGAIGLRAATSIPTGVAFVSDLGIYIFNGNQATLISEPINSEILPIDLDNIEEYTLYYDPATEKLHFFTPTNSWVYDFHHQRWYRRSLLAYQAIAFPSQEGLRTWAQLTETWADFALANTTWNDLRQKSVEPYQVYMLGDDGPDRVLGIETVGELQYFGVGMDPRWQFPSLNGVPTNQVGTSKQLLVTYEGEGGLAFDQPGDSMALSAAVTDTLPPATELAVRDIPYTKSGTTLGLRVRIISGAPKISEVMVGFIRRGPRLRPRRT